MDKDARHGAKSDEKTFTGYKGNVMKWANGKPTKITLNCQQVPIKRHFSKEFVITAHISCNIAHKF